MRIATANRPWTTATRSSFLGAALLIFATTATPVAAHPLGNESVTHFSVLDLSPEGIEVNFVLDIAEMDSAVLLRTEIDTDHDGRDTEAELEAWLNRKAGEFTSLLHLQCDGAKVKLHPADRPAETSDPAAHGNRIIVKTPGMAGMATYRLAIQYVADWPAPLGQRPHTLTYEDATFPDRKGLVRTLLKWPSLLTRVPADGPDLGVLDTGKIPEAIRAALESVHVPIPPAGRLVVEQPGRRWRFDLPPNSILIQLVGGEVCVFRLPRVVVREPRAPFIEECEVSPFLYDQYDPSDLPNERKTTVTFDVEPATNPASAPATQSGAQPRIPDTLDYRAILADPRNDPAKQGKSQRQAARLVALLQQPWGWTIFLTVTTLCFAWGAAHALMPGHAKTLVAAYLISSSGTAWHAVLLAIVVTITHTSLVIIVGLIIWLYQRTHPQVGPMVQLWLGAIAGMLVAAMGVALLRRAFVGGHHHHHGHDHHHGHAHAHDHAHNHDHAHAHDHDHPHTHGDDHAHPHDHSHAHEHHEHAPPDRVTMRVLLLLGVTGGLVPCPTATIIMLLGIGANVVVGALYAVLVFSLGLALTLMAIGFLALSSRRFAARIMADNEHAEEPSARNAWLLNRLVPAFSGLAVLALGGALTAHYLHLLRTGRGLFSWLQ